MGWFRLFDRLRLRPLSEAPEGWALPGSALRMTDPHLASYFRTLITQVGVSTSIDLFDVTSHALARSVPPQADAQLHRFHVDVRAVGTPSALMVGSDNRHAILSWHAASRSIAMCLPGQSEVQLQEADLLAMLRSNLPLSDIATLSAWLARAEALPGFLGALAPWLTNETLALIRLPGAALASLMAMLPKLPVQPVAMLPCEPEVDDPANPLPDVLLCLTGLSAQTVCAAAAAVDGMKAHETSVRVWSPQTESGRDGGLDVRALEESRSTGYGLPVSLMGDAPPTAVGAALYSMQRTPARGVAARGLCFELQAASVVRHGDDFLAVPLVGPAVFDPDLPALPNDKEIVLHRPARMRDVEARPTVLLGYASTHAEFAARIWPKLELAFDLIEGANIPASEITLLMPHGADAWTREAIALCGFDPARIRTEWEGVLFRQLILASPACDLGALRRNDIFDRFWRRLTGFAIGGQIASFTQPRNSGRVMLLSAASHLLNAPELAALARARMYRVIDPERINVTELAAALRTANVVVVERETAIWSAMASSAALGVLQADTDPEIPYAALHAAGACGHQLTAMFGSAIGDSPQSSYVVAADRLALMLDRLEASAQPGGEGA